MFTTLKQKRIVYWGLGMMFIKKMNLRITSRSKNKLFFKNHMKEMIYIVRN